MINKDIDKYYYSILNNSIKIYVGGGITKESNPADEFEETVAKSHIMKNVFY